MWLEHRWLFVKHRIEWKEVEGKKARRKGAEEGGLKAALGGFTKRPVHFDAARGIVAPAKRGLNMTRHSGSH